MLLFTGVVSLEGYLRFWGVADIVLTLAIAALKKEVSRTTGAAATSTVAAVREAYAQLLRVVALPAVRRLAVVLVVCRLGMLPAESAAAFKLLEKGVSKESLAVLVLIEFPMETVSAVLAGRWAVGKPFDPWFVGYRLRLALAGLRYKWIGGGGGRNCDYCS